MVAKENKVYVVWLADSPVINIPMGSDTFEFADDKIMLQTTAVHMIQK